ncbi:tetratricopeptide repeat protein [Bradyrhizobium sp.]|uniref:tetratricopeptide repeat protein n=1 Tax=Bradyrhizobium sp. TaxID=376 RepID=UPI001D3FF266|nr:tetratricopeptide repeat protein [Bradyrhizobium sp.]MBI5318734.1 tetratricopeptide repeat protein [Bradyrhizobium sp.]
MKRLARRHQFGSLRRAAAGIARCCRGRLLSLTLAVSVACAASSAFGQAEPVRGEAVLQANQGYARLTIKLAEDIESQVTAAGQIIVIRFKRPVAIPVGKLGDAVPAYVSSARIDPDGAAIRLSLARRVTINTMTAGERLFVDLLPDSWTGAPPPLPIEVVRELSERARAAERALRQQKADEIARKRPPVRVKTSVQPTFVRFIFEMPDGVGVSSVLNEQKLSLLFNAPLTFDLADAKVAAPPNVASINQRIDGEKSVVEAELIGDVDVHSFREEKSYIIDVAFQQQDKMPAAPARASSETRAPAPSAPAAAPLAAMKPAQEAPAKQETPEPQTSITPAEIPQPTSETIAEQARIDIKSEAAANPAPAAVQEKPQAAASPAAPVEPASPAAAAVPEKSTATEAASPPAPKAGKPQAAEAPKTMPAAAAPASPPVVAGTKAASVAAQRDADGLRVTFAFAATTPAALFRRADTVWLVFDTADPVNIDAIRSKGGALVAEVNSLSIPQGQAVRIRLNRPQLPSLSGEESGGGTKWTLTFADTMHAPSLPLVAVRNITEPSLANVSVPLANPGMLHKFSDPDAGDTLFVVTALPPIRGLIKRQDFVELTLLESIHGVAVRPNSDDVTAEIATDKIRLGKPGGLTLSSADVAAERAATAARSPFDIEEWRKNQAGPFIAREDALMRAAASATISVEQKQRARMDLARFYMARGMYHEAKGMADFVLDEAKPGFEDPGALLLRAVAHILIGRPTAGLHDLANPVIGNNYDSQLWQGLAKARQAKWAEAREKFKNVEFAIASLPPELQRIVVMDAMRASLEVKDFAGAARRRSDLDVVGVPQELRPAVSVLRGRLAEALGYDRDAMNDYWTAISSSDRESAAEAKLREVMLRQKREEIPQADALRELETLSVIWRGDAVEVKALQLIAGIYAENARYSEALTAVRTATRLQPNSEVARQAQDMASALFTELFLTPKGDDLPPVEALAMFYEFRELTPIGRRGDEMIRKLADRLVAIDLLDQAAELLQYQIDKRLEGAARAQVAARLAMVYLTNRKPDRAISALRGTRIADLSGELRQQRLLLEARAQSDVGRHDLALDIISNIGGREAVRLRSDIYWASRHWRESAEQIELYYGDRWRDFKPLNSSEKSDIIRAVVGYALAEDAIGLARFREKYAPLMSGEADRFAFETASKPANGNSAEFAEIAKMAASVDTLDGFLREMRARFPDMTARAPLPPETAKGDPVATGSLPEIVGLRQVLPVRR